MTEITLRGVEDTDFPFLKDMLREAFNWRADPEFDTSILENPEVRHYVEGWSQSTDFGVIAERSGAPAGAAWARLLTSADPGYGYVGDAIPEITLAVAPEHRGQRIGSSLLIALVSHARTLGLPGLSLSVEDGNRARSLYERNGFTVVGREGNSDTMLLSFH